MNWLYVIGAWMLWRHFADRNAPSAESAYRPVLIQQAPEAKAATHAEAVTALEVIVSRLQAMGTPAEDLAAYRTQTTIKLLTLKGAE